MQCFFKWMDHKVIRVLVLVGMILFWQCGNRDQMKVSAATCEYLNNPVGIDLAQPRFSWVIKSDVRGQKQTGYQILVADQPDLLDQDKADLWDSGRIYSDQSAHVRYAGSPLASHQTYYWKVRVWDKDKKPSAFSKIQTFITAFLHDEKWSASWIGRADSKDPANPNGFYSEPHELDENGDSLHYNPRSLLLRKSFELSQPVKQALIHVSGLGYYELNLNGKKIGDQVLAPAKTFYKKIVLYDTYDIRQELFPGKNAITLMLGNGWFNPLPKWWSWRMQWYGAKRAIVQVHITFQDGRTKVITSDPSWKIADGPILSSCVYDGEIYDANQEIPGWTGADFDDSSWEPAALLPPPGGNMCAAMLPAIKITQTIHPVKMTKTKPDVYILDMGQNFSGWIRLHLKGKKGDKVTIRYAENVQPNGMIDPRTNNLAAATDVYIMKGDTAETYQPRFTYHGFRYVEISGYSAELRLNDVLGVVVHSAVAPAGEFTCSSERINRIHQTILWSQRSNLMGLPTDCPQRDERLGWIGDAHVTAEEAMYNFDMALFYRKWLDDIQSTQNCDNGDIPYISPRPFTDGKGTPAWSSGYPLIIWYVYQHYGDRDLLAGHYQSMRKYVDYLYSTATDCILPMDNYGDWLSENSDGWWNRGEPLSTTTVYFYYSADILAKAAEILAYKEDAITYRQLAEKIKKAWHDHFYDPQRKGYDNNSQFANAFPLFLDIVPEAEKAQVLCSLIDDIFQRKGHLSTGILGSKYMLEALSKLKRSDIAYLIANQPDYPGWAALIAGRTTLSEHWNQTGSNNHVMFGSIDAWFYRTLAGINTDVSAPGFKHIIIKPYLAADLSWVKASIETIMGKVASTWQLDRDQLTMQVTIPVNAVATVYVPAKALELIKESGKPVQNRNDIAFLRMEEQCAVLQVGSGEYTFTSMSMADLIEPGFVANPVIVPSDTCIFKPNKATVRLYTETKGADIYYTLDGKEPTEKMSRYANPIILEEYTTIKAKAFKQGWHPSFSMSSQIYFVDPKLNGLRYELYEGNWTRLPDFTRLRGSSSGIAYGFNLEDLTVPAYDFALLFTGWLAIDQPGQYVFYTKSNDGSRLTIDGQLIVDNDLEHLVVEKSGKIYLKAGLHPLAITYFQSGGAKALQVLYEGPGLKKQIIPPAKLYQVR